MTETEITTAARRITRETNRRNGATIDFKLCFDRNGTLVDVYEAGMWYADPAKAPAYAVSTISGRGKHMTYRAAQDLLDAYDAHPGDREEQGMYLMMRDHERDLAAQR